MPALSSVAFIVEHGLFVGSAPRPAPQHGHRQDHIAVLAAHIKVAEDIVGDAPDVVRDPVELRLIQRAPFDVECLGVRIPTSGSGGLVMAKGRRRTSTWQALAHSYPSR